MDPRKRPKYKEARRVEREMRRANMVRRENQKEIDEIDGAFVADALGALSDLDLYIISVVRDYLRAGFRMSVRLQELHGMMIDGKILQPGEEREAVLDMLEGTMGTLRPSSKKFGYMLLERRDIFLGFSEGQGQWEKVKDLLDQALKRGIHAFQI